MPYEMTVGLTVDDDEAYARYRAEMTPLLEAHGGGFRFDFRVSEVLRSAADHPINRVFAIFFADRERKDAFFSNADYKAIKARWFEGAVSGTTLIGEYER